MLQLEERFVSKLINLRRARVKDTQRSYDVEFTRSMKRKDIFKKRVI